MDKIPSVYKFYALSPEWGEAGKDLHKAMIEFAKLHVTAALKAASDKLYESNSIDKDSITLVYPLENIK